MFFSRFFFLLLLALSFYLTPVGSHFLRPLLFFCIISFPRLLLSSIYLTLFPFLSFHSFLSSPIPPFTLLISFSVLPFFPFLSYPSLDRIPVSFSVLPFSTNLLTYLLLSSPTPPLTVYPFPFLSFLSLPTYLLTYSFPLLPLP